MPNTLRQIGMLLAEGVLFIAILGLTYALIGSAVVYLDLAEVSDLSSTNIIDPYETLAVDYIPIFVAALIGIFAVHQIIFKRPMTFSGLGTNGLLAQLAMGFSWSAVLLSTGFVVLYLCGMIEVGGTEMNFSLFIGFFLFFFVQSSFEELALRSFFLPTIAHRSNVWIAIMGSALIFTLLHVGNANINFLSLMNIFLAGVLLGVLFIYYGQIWAPIGLHVGWNFLQGSFFGFEVSGIDVYSYLDTRETGPDLWTGGAFGFEGSLFASILIGGLSLWLWRRAPEKFLQPYYPISTIQNA